jgi:UDP-N-acetylmuramate-alanine ligase
VAFLPDWADAPALLGGQVRDGDAILTLGAGDVYRLARTLAEEQNE